MGEEFRPKMPGPQGRPPMPGDGMPGRPPMPGPGPMPGPMQMVYMPVMMPVYMPMMAPVMPGAGMQPMMPGPMPGPQGRPPMPGDGMQGRPPMPGKPPMMGVEINPELDQKRTLELLSLVDEVPKHKAGKLLGIPRPMFSHTCEVLEKKGFIEVKIKDERARISITEEGKKQIEK